MQRREPGARWLDLEPAATLEVTSEEPGFAIQHARGSAEGPGSRGCRGGEQKVRIIFDQPVPLHRLELCLHEPECERTQEFVLRCSSESDTLATEIVRQQWNFNSAGSPAEAQRYAVDLNGVSALELAIRPDLRRLDAVGTLASLRGS